MIPLGNSAADSPTSTPSLSEKNLTLTSCGKLPAGLFAPGAAAVRGLEHDSHTQASERHGGAPHDPADAIVDEADTPEGTVGRAGEELPGASAVGGVPDHAVIADRPADVGVNKLHVVQTGVILNGSGYDRRHGCRAGGRRLIRGRRDCRQAAGRRIVAAQTAKRLT